MTAMSLRYVLVLSLLGGSQPAPQPPPDASPTLRGLVNTHAQSFGGFKTFDAGIAAPNVVQSTQAAVTYFVDGASGNDSNACTSSGAGACATIQGALNKAPRRTRHQTTISIATGTYSGFIVSGFDGDEGVQQTTGGLLIQGTLVNSTLATGSATGTATGGSVGSNQTFATLVNSGATWTPNDLTGRLLCTSNNTLLCPVIESNTSTTLTIVGTTALGWSAPVAGVTTYAIQDSGSVINTAVSFPASPYISAIASRAAIIAVDNSLGARQGMITFKNMMLANTSGSGIELGLSSATEERASTR